jgi:RNA polymerase sigma factor (TIGR02999 family)
MPSSAANASGQEITQLLTAWRSGDDAALERLVPLVYPELRRIAGNFMRRHKPGHSLQATALINEAYLRLVDSAKVDWQGRTHFFAVSARIMRHILVDAARRRNSQKRGGQQVYVTLDDNVDAPAEDQTDLISLDEALTRLAQMSPRQGQVVELRYFGGLTEEQVAETLKISERTVRRDWNLARTWLYRELKNTR